MRRARWGLLAALVLAASPARAVDFGVNVGALEVVLLPWAHGGFYPYLGVSLTVPLVTALALTTSLSFEWSFDQRRGGLVLVVTLDYQVSERVGLDLNVALIHDQAGLDFGSAELYLGAGPGVSFFFGKWVLSPFVNFFGGLRTPGASIVPGVNLARVF